jgi:ribosomal protein S14
MKFLKLKDLKNRQNFFKKEKKNILIKFLLTNLKNKYCLPVAGVFNNYSFFSKFLGGRTKIVRRCIITNRSRGVSRKHGASRFILRNLMQFGIIPGFKKSVW